MRTSTGPSLAAPASIGPAPAATVRPVADVVDIRVRLGPLEALGFAQQALGADGFRTTAQSEWTCLVEKGSSTNRALAGGFAERSILRLTVFDGGEGTTMLRVEKQGSGWSGGVLGAHKAGKAFAAATQRVGWSFQEASLLA